MQIAVLGGGMIGSLISHELSKDYNITVFDNTKLKLENIKTIKIDINSKKFIEEIRNYDFAVNCLPGFMGFKTLKILIKEGISCTDISFMPEDCLLLHEMAIKNNCTIIPDAGVAPGLSNLIIGNIIRENDINEIKIMVGGLPKIKDPPWNYKAPFSPIDVIEEYTRPTRIRINGKIQTRNALSDRQIFEVEGIGELEAFLTDGLRTLLNSDEKISKIPNISEYTIRYPGHADLIQKMIDDGEFSEEIIVYRGKEITVKERTCMKLFDEWKLKKEDEEFTFLIIIAKTSDNNDITYTVYDEGQNGWSSMSRTTGLTACAISKLLFESKIKEKGILCPELIGQNEMHYNFILKYLNNKGIEIKSN